MENERLTRLVCIAEAAKVELRIAADFIERTNRESPTADRLAKSAKLQSKRLDSAIRQIKQADYE